MKKAYSIIAISVFLFNCDSTEIENIKVYYSTENINTVTPLRCGDLAYFAKESLDSLLIYDKSFLMGFEKELDNLVVVEDSIRQILPRLDTRYEVTISYKDKGIEKLCFNVVGDIVFKDTTMNESKSLTSLVLDRLSLAN